MLKIINIILYIFTLITIAQSQTVVKVGAFNFYPGIFQDSDGVVKGFYCDALKELGEKENIEFVFVYGSWDEGLERIKNGDVDLLTSVAITDERLNYMDYTSTPLLTVWSEVYINPKSDIRGVLDLQGKSVAVMKNDVNGLHLQKLTQKFEVNCTFIETADFEQVFRLIADNKVDAGVVNNTFGAPKSEEYGLLSSGIVFNPFDIYLTVKKDTNKELLYILNTYLLNWKHDRNSILNVARQKWSHNRVGQIEVFPQWLQKALYLVLILVLILIVFISLLRYRVRSAIKKLKYSEGLFETFMDNTPAFVYIKDSNLKHIYQNKRVTLVNSVDSKDKNSSAKTIFEPHIANLVEKSDSFILSSQNEHINIQYNCKLNGKDIWLDDYKFYLKQPDGNPAIGGVSFDITKLKETELDLIKAKEKAEESDRLKTAFIQNMSHEIRTPMNAIMGFSSLLSENFNNKEKLEKFSKIIDNRCTDLLDIINDILDISKIESGQSTLQIEECNINELCSDLLLFIRDYQYRTKKQHIELIMHPLNDESYTIVKTDKVKLKQILVNLLSNAFKFTDTGAIQCGYEIESNKLKFYVSDTGVGIPKEKFDFIFERFAQLNNPSSPNSGGTGLGLPIVKGLVGLLGGTVWLESECDKGTTFRFTIDYIPCASQTIASDVVRDMESISINKTILIVEDDIFNSMYLSETLQMHVSKIFTVYNGTDAIEFVKNNAVDAILMDIRLPDITGYEATKEILKHNPAIIIIAQTAYAAQDEHQKAISNGCADYISKPTKKEQLLTILREHLNDKTDC